MYFFFAIGSALFLALQGALLAKVYREIDQMSAISYRGISLGITMLPLLFFVPLEAYRGLLDLFPLLFVAGCVAAISNTFFAISVSRLVVGMTNSVSFTMATLVTVLIDRYYFLRELSYPQILLMGLLLFSLSLLSIGKDSDKLVHKGGLFVGILFGALSGSLLAVAFIIVGELSKISHPFLVGYLWEIFIGVIAGSIAFGRGVISDRVGLESISRHQFLEILWYSSPTVLGTALYLYALTTGPAPIAMALLSTAIVFSVVFGWMFYREEITVKQGVLLVFVTALVGALKFFA